jgi:hypothetical protein
VELPVQKNPSSPWRTAEEVRAMAVVVQANLVHLKTIDARRREIPSRDHEIRVPSPGAVLRHREHLLDRERVGAYSDPAVRLRLHEIWGQYCLMSWLFTTGGDVQLTDLSSAPANASMRCPPEIEIKAAEVHAMLWRLRFEQRRRSDPAYRDTSTFSRDQELSEQIPLRPFGKEADQCTEDELLLSACEHAGMLAALRWTMDRTREWNAPGLMDVAEQPF